MTAIDSLLRLSKDTISAPKDLVSRVLRALPALRERLYRRAVAKSALVLCLVLALFFYALSSLAIALSSLSSLDLWAAIWDDPSVLALRESWYALVEGLPVLSSLLSLVILIAVVMASKKFLRVLFSA